MTTINLSIDTTGIQQRARELGKHTQIPKAADKVLGDFVKDLAKGLTARPYPPPRPNQRYVRTGRLGRSWASGRVAQNKHYIDNTARADGRYYASRVLGNSLGKEQAWMHAGRWYVFRSLLDNKIPQLSKDLAQAVKDTVS